MSHQIKESPKKFQKHLSSPVIPNEPLCGTKYAREIFDSKTYELDNEFDSSWCHACVKWFKKPKPKKQHKNPGSIGRRY